MKGALDVHRELLARDVPHEVVRLRTRLLTADDLPRVLQVEQGCVAVRCYVVERPGAARPAFAAVLVPAGTLPSPRLLLEVLGARSVRPAAQDQVNAATDYAAGLVSPVCLPADVELLADARLRDSDVSYCALGEGGVALGIRTADLLAATGARVAVLAVPRAAADRAERDGVARVIDLDRAAGPRADGRPAGRPGPGGGRQEGAR